MMNPEVKQKWIAALRSGEYQQGHTRLRDGNNFCCLGVLCDLHSKETNVAWEKKNFHFSYLGDETYPSDEVIDWAGLENENPYIEYNHNLKEKVCSTLSGVNDTGMSFSMIANIIESEL